MSNSVDPDETAHYEPSHLDLCCLQKPILSPVAVKELSTCCCHMYIGEYCMIILDGRAGCWSESPYFVCDNLGTRNSIDSGDLERTLVGIISAIFHLQ